MADWSGGGWLVALGLSIAVVGCTSASAVQSGGQAAPPRSDAIKVLTIGEYLELKTFGDFVGIGGVEGGNGKIRSIAHNYLSAADSHQVFHPQLAQELPSIEAGSWKLNADGTMDMTWKLRANVKWHDGVPFTSEDLVFSLGLHQDPSFNLVDNLGNVILDKH